MPSGFRLAGTGYNRDATMVTVRSKANSAANVSLFIELARAYGGPQEFHDVTVLKSKI
jgi:hypothetical protein